MHLVHFPPSGLRLRTPRLELRLPDPGELDALAELAAEGVHAPDEMPFLVPWTDAPPAERARSAVTHHWRTLGSWTPDQWTLPFTVFLDGTVVGVQSISGFDFAVTREAGTGSWLGLRHQGKGIGTEMRAAVLELAFTGLAAETAASTAFADNAASLAVSRRLGYRPNGTARVRSGDTARVEQRLVLDRAAWERHRTTPVLIDGLAPCLPLFGLDPAR
ncbi:GNAT family N-acetyltransferase [Actinomadura atramentaria]|uniref:GNAT family N-acetyltransferase n=1 Tax=Actinomadura atramentaria TaxID=1990 RepID=UPI00037FDCF5|nr:GNAT family protein [Actinomadura atramentaria]